jgi:hypothetical protein
MPNEIARSIASIVDRHSKWIVSAHGKRKFVIALPANASLGITNNVRDLILSDS